MARSDVPDLMPVLSEGKHRNPRKGACFMELASYLAGERWSDHPKCTHPLLAFLARGVNDHVSAAARQRLVSLIPDVIGLNSDDPRVDAWIALDASLAAVPVAAAGRQGVMALGALRSERVLNELEGRSLDYVSPHTRQVLASVPHAVAWSVRYTEMGFGSGRSFARRSAPAIVHSALLGIANACVPDPDTILVDLLASTIGKYHTELGVDTPLDVPVDQWRSMCELTSR